MQTLLNTIRNFLIDIIFPKFCLNCGKEGSYLCQDCFSLIDILQRQYCPFCPYPKIVFDGKTCSPCRKSKKLAGLYCAVSYDSFIVKKMINQFKYKPYIKELSKPLASLIVVHLINLNKLSNFAESILIPVPLHKKKLKQRGFNQAEEIEKELLKLLNPGEARSSPKRSIPKISILNNVLTKIKQTPAQVELKKEQREKNIKGVFVCQKPELVKGKKIFLIDDIFTTGSTMEECARVLKKAGAQEVWGIAVARG